MLRLGLMITAWTQQNQLSPILCMLCDTDGATEVRFTYPMSRFYLKQHRFSPATSSHVIGYGGN